MGTAMTKLQYKTGIKMFGVALMSGTAIGVFVFILIYAFVTWISFIWLDAVAWWFAAKYASTVAVPFFFMGFAGGMVSEIIE